MDIGSPAISWEDIIWWLKVNDIKIASIIEEMVLSVTKFISSPSTSHVLICIKSMIKKKNQVVIIDCPYKVWLCYEQWDAAHLTYIVKIYKIYVNVIHEW